MTERANGGFNTNRQICVECGKEFDSYKDGFKDGNLFACSPKCIKAYSKKRNRSHALMNNGILETNMRENVSDEPCRMCGGPRQKDSVELCPNCEVLVGEQKCVGCGEIFNFKDGGLRHGKHFACSVACAKAFSAKNNKSCIIKKRERIKVENLSDEACIECGGPKHKDAIALCSRCAGETLKNMRQAFGSNKSFKKFIKSAIIHVANDMKIKATNNVNPEAIKTGEAIHEQSQPNDDPRQYGGETLPSEEDVRQEEAANESENNTFS